MTSLKRPFSMSLGLAIWGLGVSALVQHSVAASDRISIRAAGERSWGEFFAKEELTPEDPGPAYSSSFQPQSTSMRLLWKRAFPREISWAFRQPERSEPVVVGDRLLVGGSRFSGVLILEKRSGAVVQKWTVHGGLEVPPVFDSASGDYIVADNGGFVQRLRPDGASVWEHEAQGPILSRPALGQGLVIFHDIDGTLVALDFQTGMQQWVYRRPARVGESLTIFGAANPIIVGDRVITGFSDGRAAALKLTDGSLLWEQSILADGRWLDVDGDITPLGNSLVLVSAFKGATTCLSVETGEQVWRASIGSPGGAVEADGKVYVPDTAGTVYALNSKTGEQVWKWETPSKQQPLRPAMFGSKLLVPLTSGELQLVDPESGQSAGTVEVDENLTGFSAPAVVSDEQVFAVSDGGIVYAFGMHQSKQIPLASKGAAWSHLNY